MENKAMTDTDKFLARLAEVRSKRDDIGSQINDLMSQVSVLTEQKRIYDEILDGIEDEVPTGGRRQSSGEPRTRNRGVADAVFGAVQELGEEGGDKATVRETLIKQGHTVNENSLGTTLAGLLKKNSIVRDGKNYRIPPRPENKPVNMVAPKAAAKRGGGTKGKADAPTADNDEKAEENA
jgi:hypothetical protein